MTPPNAPLTPDLALPAEAADLDLGNVVIDKNGLPYVQEWFDDTKQPDDTPLKFLLRMVYQSALRHRVQKLAVANQGEESDDPATQTHASQAFRYRIKIEDDFSILADAIEGVLP